MAELQCKLNFQSHRVSVVKVKASSGKEWYPENWNGDIWEDPDEAENTEFQWVFFASRSKCSILFGGDELCFTWEDCDASPEVVALQDFTDSPQDLSSLLFFISRPTVRLKFL